MGVYALLAEAFRYPYPGLREKLTRDAATAGRNPARKGLAAFLKQINGLSLTEWEELVTRTLDLSPAAAPYVGFQVWGDSYQRGAFMARLNREMAELDIDPEGELPDHLIPVLRYLDRTERPLPELHEHLKTALQRMIAIIKEKDRRNPYLDLLNATLAAAQSRRATT